MTNDKMKPLFSEAELMPASGFPEPDYGPERLAALTGWNEGLEAIYVHNPNHKPVLRALDMVLAMGRPGSRYVVRNSAESYAGKSAAADEFARIVSERKSFPEGSMPVVRVELEQACTSRRFWSSIVRKYEDGFASSKDEDSLRASAYDAFEQHGTVLLIIDEVQHAGYRSHGSSAATDVIKRFRNDGKVGLALFGNENAAELLESNLQLGHRLLPPCDIKPLNIASVPDQEVFAKFLAKYDRQLTSKLLFEKPSMLDEARVASCLMAVSKGYLGRVVALLQVAARRAFLRHAERIEVCDLSDATSTWGVEQKLTGTDPFRFGMAKTGG